MERVNGTSLYSEAPIVLIAPAVGHVSVALVAKRYRVSEPSFYSGSKQVVEIESYRQ